MGIRPITLRRPRYRRCKMFSLLRVEFGCASERAKHKQVYAGTKNKQDNNYHLSRSHAHAGTILLLHAAEDKGQLISVRAPAKMASKFTEQERAVLKECKRKALLEGLSWGASSVLLVWVTVRTRLLSPAFAPAGYTVAFVLFSFLGSMSRSSACIDKILDMEDSKLAQEVRKSLPQQARRYDEQKRLRKAEKKDKYQTPGGSGDVPATSTDRLAPSGPSWSSYQGSSSRGAGQEESNDAMPQRERPLRRNKYGDLVYDDDYK